MAVKRRHLPMNIRQRLLHEDVDPAQEMRFGNPLIELERIKELTLISVLASHHQRNPSQITQKRESHRVRSGNEFFNSIDPNLPFTPFFSPGLYLVTTRFRLRSNSSPELPRSRLF